MPAHLRVSVPDRPGSLAALTAALAHAGANVQSVSVTDREAGRAVDDLLLDWPYGRAWDAVTTALDSCPGVRVHGLRHIAEPSLTHDADLLGQVAAAPERALETVVDGLPHLLLADWCALFARQDPRQPEYATPGCPLPLPETDHPLSRPRTMAVDGESLLLVPVPSTPLRVLVGRFAGPGFTRAEMHRCSSLLATATAIAQLADESRLSASSTPV
jgi:ACT domain-containing protein